MEKLDSAEGRKPVISPIITVTVGCFLGLQTHLLPSVTINITNWGTKNHETGNRTTEILSTPSMLGITLREKENMLHSTAHVGQLHTLYGEKQTKTLPGLLKYYFSEFDTAML